MRDARELGAGGRTGRDRTRLSGASRRGPGFDVTHQRATDALPTLGLRDDEVVDSKDDGTEVTDELPGCVLARSTSATCRL